MIDSMSSLCTVSVCLFWVILPPSGQQSCNAAGSIWKKREKNTTWVSWKDKSWKLLHINSLLLMFPCSLRMAKTVFVCDYTCFCYQRYWNLKSELMLFGNCEINALVQMMIDNVNTERVWKHISAGKMCASKVGRERDSSGKNKAHIGS